ncbi:ABC transporter ATP-binding protein [Pseudobutyrivibrio xylanivorans]|uniref:Teichoic acid transport system ATP-binding protein n=1 Tax=Pseudobutyrivibrio xylanivorans DSM 14809 TaxID=1123012 RepID=A0A1M6I0M0_PSEXY|nr:ABC transporter ATP-binding protein [Pseudobutyrivibrio xylanivorans]SHJ27951.1 teichoic acid transport system ATP-binding protein [Pseudobutyrivibrio xylanivorans DSM 14809]
MSDYVIEVNHVDKVYKLFDSNKARVADTLGLTRKKNYKEHYALKDMSFAVKQGECVGLIGTNGSGKSTILKIITGVLSPTKGNVHVDGRISALLELGAGFNQEYTGIENIYLNGTMLGYSKEEIDAKLDDILNFADIGDFVFQPVKTYSSGMFVRLAFAVAINIDPEILIVDEALSVGDVFFQAKCYKKFEEFKAAGKTILFVSHDLGAISKYCDRAVLINKGDKVAEGTPKDMIDIYKKILVGQEPVLSSKVDLADAFNTDGADGSQPKQAGATNWKSNYQLNPNVNEYGDGRASIVDFAVIDDNGNYTNAIMKGSTFTVKSKVHFNTDIENPIFTLTFKTLKGIDVTGTNTMYEKCDVGLCKEGSEYVATFTQKMDMQGGEYLMSISCTGYDGVDFVAYHRLYDVMNITVVSTKNTVGYYDMNSKVTVTKVKD